MIIDPAVRAAQFIATIKAHGMRSVYESQIKQPVVTRRTLDEATPPVGWRIRASNTRTGR